MRRFNTIGLYLVTISCQQKSDFIRRSQLDDVLLWLKMSVDSLQYKHINYECSGRYGQLHVHAIVAVKPGFSYAPFTQCGDLDRTYNTFRVQWDHVYDLKGAVSYCSKDLRNSTQGEIFIRNYFNYHYFNIDRQNFIPVRAL